MINALLYLYEFNYLWIENKIGYSKLFSKKMKRLFLVPLMASAVLIAACGGGQQKEESTDTNEVATDQAPDLNVPGLDTVAISNEWALEGNDLMQYDKKLLHVKAGQPVKLTFKNAGEMPKESMGHNVVILQPGTDLPAFGGEAIKAVDAEYIPATFASSIIAHTKLLGPGETDVIEFTLEKGVYPYVCSFPGHYGVMQGKIVAE